MFSMEMASAVFPFLHIQIMPKNPSTRIQITMLNTDMTIIDTIPDTQSSCYATKLVLSESCETCRMGEKEYKKNNHKKGNRIVLNTILLSGCYRLC